MREQGYIEADDTQARAFDFGMASLGQLGIGLRVDEGVEVGRIKGQGTQTDVKLLDEPRCKLMLNNCNRGGIQIARMAPEALTCQGALEGG